MSETAEVRDIVLSVNALLCEREENIARRGGLNNISFSFEKKGVHGILAPKSSGKTLLMDIIAGCQAKDSGEVLICGAPVTENALDIKKRIGYVQKRNVFYPDMTAVEIMSFVGETRRVESGKLYRQIKEAMELTGIDGIKNKQVKNMSEFDRKKLALAAALLGNPDILLLDETVTPKMSDDHISELLGLIQMLGRMKTVVMTTDDYKIAKAVCEDVVIISDGQVLAKGSFDALEEKIRTSGGASSLEELYNSLVFASDKKHSADSENEIAR